MEVISSVILVGGEPTPCREDSLDSGRSCLKLCLWVAIEVRCSGLPQEHLLMGSWLIGRLWLSTPLGPTWSSQSSLGLLLNSDGVRQQYKNWAISTQCKAPLMGTFCSQVPEAVVWLRLSQNSMQFEAFLTKTSFLFFLF